MTLHERAIACTKWCCKAVVVLTIIGFFIIIFSPKTNLADAVIYGAFCAIVYFPIILLYLILKRPQHIEHFKKQQEHTQRAYINKVKVT